jgi:hypothetical protein
MKALPYSIFKVVQGLSYPRQSEIRVSSEWDTSDWACTQKIVDEISQTTDIVIVSTKDAHAESVIEKFNRINYKFHIVIFGHTKADIREKYGLLNPTIIQSRESFLGIIIHKNGDKSFITKKIKENRPIDIDDPQFFLPEFKINLWTQEKNKVMFKAPNVTVEFIVPKGFSLKRTSLDLLWAIENVLLSPWHEKYNKEWVPTRRPGNSPGLSFSGGIDSTAAMCLMPSDTRLFYLERNFESMIQHENAYRFIEHLKNQSREVISIKSNHELIRTFHDKNPGFSTDYACMAHLILVADFFDLDAAATGMPLENAYFFHGSKVRNFQESSFWKRYAPMFSYLGIPIYQPVAGCSEIVNNTIVNKNGYKGFASSCLRSNVAGKTCNNCWKCFRKNIFNKLDWEMSPEISKFLSKRPLKQGIATLYALQMLYEVKQEIPEEANDLKSIMKTDLDFLNRYWAPSLELIPLKYRESTMKKINAIVSKIEIDLYSLDNEIFRLLRGE